MAGFGTLLGRGLLLHCPVCGVGNIYQRPFKLNVTCPHCEYRFEREPGYFTSAIAINLVICELFVTGLTISLAVIPGFSWINILLIVLPVIVALPLLFLHHCRSVWMAMDQLMHPMTRDDLEKQTRLFTIEPSHSSHN